MVVLDSIATKFALSNLKKLESSRVTVFEKGAQDIGLLQESNNGAKTPTPPSLGDSYTDLLLDAAEEISSGGEKSLEVLRLSELFLSMCSKKHELLSE